VRCRASRTSKGQPMTCLCRHRLETEVAYSSSQFTTSALEVDESPALWSGSFMPGKRPGTHCTGSWVGPRSCLDGHGKSGPPPPTGTRSLDRPARSECLYQLNYPGRYCRKNTPILYGIPYWKPFLFFTSRPFWSVNETGRVYVLFEHNPLFTASGT
jgi:hypothetical protein